MKRSYSKPITKAPSWIPTQSQPDVNRCGKRVKFTDTDVDSSLNVKATRSDEVKTSEFAFFKKLKEDASKNFASSLSNNAPNQTDNFISVNDSRENFPNNRCKEKVNSSLLIENATPVQFASLHSPFGSDGTRKNSDVRKKKACSSLENTFWIQKDMEEYGPNSRSEGSQYKHEDIFSRKREKLGRWVTDVSFPEIDGLCSKGCDIVPVLLKRLIPECKDIDIVNDQKLGQEQTDTETQLLPPFESDIFCNRLQWMPRHYPELECEPYIGDDIPNPLWNRSRGRILLLDAPLRHDNEVHHYYHKPWDSGLDEGELGVNTDSSFIFPFRKHRSVELLDEFYQPNRNLVGNQSNTPALDWYYDKEKFERALSIIGSHDIQPNSNRSSLASWVNDDDEFYANGSLASSNVHMNKESEYSLPYPHNHDLRVEILEDQDGIHTLPDSHHLPLTLSYRPDYFDPDEDDIYDDTGSPHQDQWCMSKRFSQMHHYPSLTKALQSSEHALSLGWKCFPEENHSSSYLALEYPGEGRSQSREASHCNMFDEFESRLNESSRRNTLAHFNEDSEDNIHNHDWSPLCYQVSNHYP